MKYSQITNLIMPTFLLALLSSCELARERVESETTIVLDNDESTLVERVAYTNEKIVIESDNSTTYSQKPGSKGKSKDEKISEMILTLVAEVAAPIYDSQALQATDVRIKGKKAYVVYNTSGDRFLRKFG